MKEKKIKILIVIMTFAVVGLISLQIFWSIKTLKMEEIRFDATINKIMNDVVLNLEKNRTANIIIDKVGEGKDLIIWVDSTSNKMDSNKIMFFGSNSNGSIKQTKKGNNYEMNIEINSEFENESEDKKGEKVLKRIIKVDKQVKNDKNGQIPQIDTISINKHRLVKEVLEEMVSFEKEQYFNKNMNIEILDSVIKTEFNNQGIETVFNFGIFDSNKKQFVVVNPNGNSRDLQNSKYQTSLSPHDVFSNSILLVLEIPNRFNLILKSIWVMFFSALLFIGIIIWVFIKTVKMFWEQKKVTEIKNDLISNISHEFKTPISTISLATEALLEPKLLEQENSIKKYSRIIGEENQKLNKLVENLLSSAAFEKSEIKLEKEKINIIQLLENTISQFKERNSEVGITLDRNLEEDLVLNVDKFHFGNVITNLFDNAVKYSTDEKEIKVELRSVNYGLEISISDKGIGISKANHSKIFETFFRVQSGNIHDVKGYGIGLSYVKKIVEAHNGKIEVFSKLGSGTTFKIFLPNE